ncbi:RAE1 [Bugula neritina]|uniref:RAE1 n=1 Tax=Bugula neritina TaxID=10212 RepID=A0A7J7K2M3_BUGNE|nr:RAE1 [Bugula neritina]
MFSGSSSGTGFNTSSVYTWSSGNANPNKDIVVASPPEDSISSLAWSPTGLFLCAGSWNNTVRCWEVQQTGQTVPKAEQSHTHPILDVAWSDDGTKIFTASCDKTAKMWDLATNQATQIAQHDAPIKAVHWIKAPTYSCVMTASWDKTLKFWDTRTPTPMASLNLPERAFCVDVVYPMAVVGTANKQVIIYQLDGQPREFRTMESPLKFQHRVVSIFKDKKTNMPAGFALGGIEGRVAIHYVNTSNPKDNFSFKCHRSVPTTTGAVQDIFAVNDIAFHPVHGTLATVGSDGRFNFWDKDVRTKLKTSEQLNQPITACSFDSTGKIFAYAGSYDWSQGHEGYNQQQMKPAIYLRDCFDELKQNQNKK